MGHNEQTHRRVADSVSSMGVVPYRNSKTPVRKGIKADKPPQLKNIKRKVINVSRYNVKI